MDSKNFIGLVEAYAAVYDEDLREEYLEEDFSFVDELSDNELEEVVEEVVLELIDEGYDVEDIENIFEETFITEATVTYGKGGEAGTSKKVTTGTGTLKAAQARVAARKQARREARKEKIKTVAKGVASALAGGAAEAGRKAKRGAEKVKKAVSSAKQSAKEKIKSAIKSGRQKVAGGLRKAAAAVEPKEKAAERKTTYRGEGAGRKEKVSSGSYTPPAKVKATTKTVRAPKGSTTHSGGGVGRKEAASSGGIKSKGGSIGREGSQGRALPPVGKTKSGKTLTSSQRATQTAAQNRRLAARLGEEVEIWVNQLLDEGYDLSMYTWDDMDHMYMEQVEPRVDLFDIVFEHLIENGYAESEDSAIQIMANMSEEWRDEILDESGYWIQKAIKKPGSLHKQLGVPMGEKIPSKKLAAAAKKGGKLGKRARLAQTLKGLS